MNESAIIAASNAHPRPSDILYAYGTAGFRTTSVSAPPVPLRRR